MHEHHNECAQRMICSCSVVEIKVQFSPFSGSEAPGQASPHHCQSFRRTEASLRSGFVMYLRLDP